MKGVNARFESPGAKAGRERVCASCVAAAGGVPKQIWAVARYTQLKRVLTPSDAEPGGVVPVEELRVRVEGGRGFRWPK